MDGASAESAFELRDELVEILKQLNRVEMEETKVEGLEIGELRRILARGSYPSVTTPEVVTALTVLVGNGMARQHTDLEYAWDRGRVVGERYSITTEGKAYLIETLRRTNRVE